MKERKALGSGLENLFGDIDGVYEKAYDKNSHANKIHEIQLDLIMPNPMQPRQSFDEESLQELASSISQHGLLQPIVVRKNDEGSYILIAGERRLRATKILKKESIQAIIVDAKEHKMRELALIENIQRENLNPIDLALCYQALLREHDLTHEQLSQKIQKSRVQLTNTLRLLDLSDETKALVREGKITQGHAKTLIGLSPEHEKLAIQTILGQKLNVRDTEVLTKKLKTKIDSKTQEIQTLKNTQESQITHKLQELQEVLKSHNIHSSIKNTHITLHCDDENMLEALIAKLR